MDWTVAEGKTFDDAVENLLISLGADRSEVEIEELGTKKKMFGLGPTVIRIRGKLKEDAFDAEDATIGKRGDVSMDILSNEIAKIGGGPVSEAGEATRKYLNDILHAMDITDAQVKATEKKGAVILDIQSKAGGLIIGRKGETLEALQTIVEIFATRQKGGRLKVIVDTENYRNRMQGKLEDAAKKAAKDAVERGRKVMMKPMKPGDRKVVHAVLQENPDVETRSEGKGESRRVAVVPVNKTAEASPASE